MRGIHNRVLFNIKSNRLPFWRFFVLFLACGFALRGLLSVGNVIASTAGGMGAVAGWGYYQPEMNFDGLYLVTQDNDELELNQDSIYMVSEYNKAIHLWVNLNEIGNDERYYYKVSCHYYDQNHNELDLSNNSPRTGLISRNDSDYSAIPVTIDQRAAISSFVYEIYDAIPNSYDYYDDGETLYDTITLNFSYADYDANHLPEIELLELSQGGEVLQPYDYDSFYSYSLNSAEDVILRVIGRNIIEGNTFSSYLFNKQVVFTKTDLENGVEIIYPANTSPSYVVGQSNFAAVFGYNNNVLYNGKQVILSTNVNNNSGIPDYGITLKYHNSDKVISTSHATGDFHTDEYESFNRDDYDSETNPLDFVISGREYVSDQNYTVKVRALFAGAEIVNDEFSATGAELNNGIVRQYFDDVPYVKLASLFDHTFAEETVSVIAEIGYTTRHLSFGANGNGQIGMTLLSSAGLPLPYYNNTVGSAGGNSFVGGAGYTISRQLFGDHAYIKFGTISDWSDYDSVDYYIYAHDNIDDWNDLSNATLVKQGSIVRGEEIGLMRFENPTNSDHPIYTIVTAKGDRIADVMHYVINLSEHNRELGFMPVIRPGNSEGSIVNVGNSQYYITENTPIELYAYGDNCGNSDYSMSIKLSSGTETLYENVIEFNGSALDGSSKLLSLAYNELFTGSNDYASASVKIFNENNETVAGGFLHFNKMPADNTLNDIGLEESLLQIRELESAPASFNAILESDETFEDEFDVYLKVSDYNNMSDKCSGICGLVGNLSYDQNKIELITTEALGEFELTQGERLVLNRETGVPTNTRLLRLHFANVSLGNDESTEIVMENIIGSDGEQNIPASDASVTVRRHIPLRNITSKLFLKNGEFVQNLAGALIPNGISYQVTIDDEVFGADAGLTIYYEGYGFDNNSSYDYVLKRTTDLNSVATQLVSGTIDGATLNDGHFRLTADGLDSVSSVYYILDVYHNNDLIFTVRQDINVVSGPAMYIRPRYNSSFAEIVDGRHSVPRDSGLSLEIEAYNLDASKTYTLNYSYSDYEDCGKVEQDGHVEEICHESSSGSMSNIAVSVTGEQLLSGHAVALQSPLEQTSLRRVNLSLKDGPNTIASSLSEIAFINPEDIVTSPSDIHLQDDMTMDGININKNSTEVESGLDIADGYTVRMINYQDQILGPTDKVGTGTRIQFIDEYNQVVLEYIAIIKGDVSGDGNITVLDLVKAKRNLAGLETIDYILSRGGDIIGVGHISITDVVKICRHVAGIEEIKQ